MKMNRIRPVGCAAILLAGALLLPASRAGAARVASVPNLIGAWNGLLESGQPPIQLDFNLQFNSQRGSQFSGFTGVYAMGGTVSPNGTFVARTIPDRGR